ncbi:MAG: hypothetical protein ACXW27_00215 [Allosphingosinicella sp.]
MLVVIESAYFLQSQGNYRQRQDTDREKEQSQGSKGLIPPVYGQNEANYDQGDPEANGSENPAPVEFPLDIRAFIILAGAILATFGTVAVVLVAADRRAGERGLLRIELAGCGATATVSFINMGRTAVLVRRAADRLRHWDRAGGPSGDLWRTLSSFEENVPPFEESVPPYPGGRREMSVNISRFYNGEPFAVLVEYEDVFGQVWRAWCGFRWDRSTGTYVREGERERRR